METSLAYALTYALAINPSRIGPAAITILADSDYYSSSGASSPEASSTAKRFLDFNVRLQEAHKTGLGSSAALVTAFTAAIVAHYVPRELLDVTSQEGKARVHNLAQVAHCAAQGKVGSGFDVAAAVYGSCVYRRFSPSILDGIGDVGTKSFAGRLRSIIDDSDSSKKWNMDVDKSSALLPQGLRLLMCDVDCGSETVGMVKKVLAWRKEKPEEAKLLWATLQKGNEDLIRELQTLRRQDQDLRVSFDDLKDIIVTIRSMIREMSDEAGVPIEPPIQTDLLDTCSKVDGVMGGVVPGAGGFDAIALVVKDQDAVTENLRELFANYKVKDQGGQGMSIGKIGLLGVKQDNQGLKVEEMTSYDDWKREHLKTA